jgi:hypothetical protein
MALWDKVKQELDRAGQVAQEALDEGRVRLEAHRSRQLADKAAQILGYAMYRARSGGAELDAETYARLSSTVASHEADVARYEQRLVELREARKREDAGQRNGEAAPPPPSSDPPA